MILIRQIFKDKICLEMLHSQCIRGLLEDRTIQHNTMLVSNSCPILIIGLIPAVLHPGCQARFSYQLFKFIGRKTVTEMIKQPYRRQILRFDASPAHGYFFVGTLMVWSGKIGLTLKNKDITTILQ